MAKKGEIRSFDVTPEQLFSAVLQAVVKLGYSVKHSDPATRIVSFATGMSMRSWAGQDMTVAVLPEGAGKSQLVIGGTRAQSGNIVSGGGQIYDWGERGKVARLFFETVTEILKAAVGTPAATKECPFCAETIKRDAIVCRYCGRDLMASAPSVGIQPAVRTSSGKPFTGLIRGDGKYGYKISGAASYQVDIERIVGGRTGDGAHHTCVALVEPEPTNVHDPGALVVRIEGTTVGYIQKGHTELVREALAAVGCGAAESNALIMGGWEREDGDKGYFGVRLDIRFPLTVEHLTVAPSKGRPGPPPIPPDQRPDQGRYWKSPLIVIGMLVAAVGLLVWWPGQRTVSIATPAVVEVASPLAKQWADPPAPPPVKVREDVPLPRPRPPLRLAP